MKNLRLLVLAAMAAALAACGSPKPDTTVLMYVGSFTDAGGDGVYACRLDTVTGALSGLQSVATLKNPNYLTLSADGSRLYTYNNLRPDTAELLTYAVDKTTGALTELARFKVPALTLSYVAMIEGGKWLGTVSFSEGKTLCYPLDAQGIALDKPAIYVHTAFSNVNPQRQDAPHAHSIEQDPATGELYVPDLGADRTMIFSLKNDSLHLDAEVAYAPGAGPRHLAFHPSGNYMVTVNELDNTAALFARDSARRFSRLLQTVSTLPETGWPEETTAADIHFTPDGKFLYASNRGENSVAMYGFDEAYGTITSLGNVREGIDFPRNFVIDPSGKFLLVANQTGNDIVVYALDPVTGLLTITPNQIEVMGPSCLKFSL
ncbi:MAG: lactonase family protein [Rikenellaceae bacterium]|jgi:6-phosphogluconolactonase|nr:lactonase family protein [Rikenellaceae bacterium]